MELVHRYGKNVHIQVTPYKNSRGDYTVVKITKVTPTDDPRENDVQTLFYEETPPTKGRIAAKAQGERIALAEAKRLHNVGRI